MGLFCCASMTILAQDFSGIWEGSWSSSYYGTSDELKMEIAQDGSSLIGYIRRVVDGSGTLFTDVALTDSSVSDGKAVVHGTIVDQGVTYYLSYSEGVINGDVMTGNYYITGDGEPYDIGTFSMTRTSGGDLPADAYEPDDVASQAKWITSGESQGRSLHRKGNEDWAKFTVVGTRDVVIETSGADGGDTILSLYGPNNATFWVADNDDSELGGSYSRISETLSAGTYYVQVQNYDSSVVLDSYQLFLSTTLPSMEAPAGVAASELTHTDKVRVTWESSVGASYYRIYRVSVPLGETTNAVSAWQTSLYFDDETAAMGEMYHYFVCAAASSSGAQVSEYSDFAYGVRGVPAPTSVQATDGESDFVRVSWSSIGASEPTDYCVYRTSLIEPTKTAVGSWTSSRSFNDASAVPGITYSYFIKASVGAVISDFSDPAEGKRPLSIPTGVSASDGSFTDKVRVEWDSVEGGSGYQVYRADSPSSTKTALYWVSSLYYDDTTAVPGTIYYYFVQAVSGDTPMMITALDDEFGTTSVSGFSAYDAGYRALSVPADVAATDGTYAEKVNISWDGSTGASHYQVYRATHSGGTKMPISSWLTGLNHNDTTAAPDTTYFYFIRAATSSSGAMVSEYSTYDSGHLRLSPPVLTLELPESLLENSGVSPDAGRVQISRVLESNVTVYLESSDLSELSVPSTLLIPAGSSSVPFDVTLPDDDLRDGVQLVEVLAQVQGWSGSTGTVSILDDDARMVFESFETGLGSWTDSIGYDFSWERNSWGTSSSGTGPAEALDEAYYLYTESSNPNFPAKVAAIESAFDFSDTSDPSLSFHYHMYGTAMGTLYVDVFDGVWHLGIWSLSGQQQTSNASDWKQAAVDLSAYGNSSNVKIRFRGITGSSYTSDIALDRIEVRGVRIVLDADNDGLPDAWEDLHGGDLDPAAVCANGINTVREAYIAGLDPTNATSRLLLNLASGNALHWSAISGRVYSIWWTTNLLENFQPLETNIPWTEGLFTNTNPPASDQIFYKMDVRFDDEDDGDMPATQI